MSESKAKLKEELRVTKALLQLAHDDMRELVRAYWKARDTLEWNGFEADEDDNWRKVGEPP